MVLKQNRQLAVLDASDCGIIILAWGVLFFGGDFSETTGCFAVVPAAFSDYDVPVLAEAAFFRGGFAGAVLAVTLFGGGFAEVVGFTAVVFLAALRRETLVVYMSMVTSPSTFDIEWNGEGIFIGLCGRFSPRSVLVSG